MTIIIFLSIFQKKKSFFYAVFIVIQYIIYYKHTQQYEKSIIIRSEIVTRYLKLYGKSNNKIKLFLQITYPIVIIIVYLC